MKVRFIKSADRDFPPPSLPEVVFLGRSNVGKSSLINMITGRNIARVSKEPGRTRMINYFVLEEKVYLVDVPGYGFARVPELERKRWKYMMENYFRERRENIRIAFLLVDAVVGPLNIDMKTAEWLEWMAIPYRIVLTKVDKATQKELSKSLKAISKLGYGNRPILSSSREGKGRKEILSLIL